MEQVQVPTSGFELQSAHLFSGQSDGAATLAAVAHDARNMVAALGVYCDLLEEPGVFAEPYQHYGSELRTVATASRGLVDKLLALCSSDSGNGPEAGTETGNTPLEWPPVIAQQSATSPTWTEIAPTLIDDFAWELQTNRGLLAALAGPSISLTIDAVGCALPVRLSAEDLTRILVNLVKNSVEAISDSGGHIQLILRECQAGPGNETRLLLNIEDNGIGIAQEALDRIFEPGYTTRCANNDPGESNCIPHRGLGLSIARAILHAAGGCIRAANRDPHGTCMQIELPVSRAE